jgi:predicted TIM-barrel fold metal-dependent hydrolase
VLKDFPKLKLNLAHFGGEDDWIDYQRTIKIYEESWIELILNLMRRYKNVYTDIAYTLHKKENFGLLKKFLKEDIIKDKILFGSDFYMDEISVNENHFSDFLKNEIGEENFHKIAIQNNNKFLN